MTNNPALSIIVLSYNTKELLKQCLLSLERLRREVKFELIVPDNGSTDGSPEMVEVEFPWVKKVIRIGRNIGFAAGNNRAKKCVEGEFVLFLNSDTIVSEGTLKDTVGYLKRHPDVGALTCKILLPNGKLDKDARRSFITPWVGFTHLILRLDRIFPNSRIFAPYWYGSISPDIEHDVDVIQGAFFLTRRSILDEVGWFDEDYFLDGEDIDLCWKIKEKGWRIIYYPKVSIIHFKGASKGKRGHQTNRRIPFEQRLKFRMAGVDSMELFYRKRLWKKYPLLFNYIVIFGIKLLKGGRYLETLVFG
jgi:GT2 family glycosyltransferase